MSKIILLACFFVFSIPSYAAFFKDAVRIQKDHRTCDESMHAFSVRLSAAMMVPIAQMTSRQIYNTTCEVSFTYVSAKKIMIVNGSWGRGVSTGICTTYREFADRRIAALTDIPLLSTACDEQIFHYAFVNHENLEFTKKEEVFLESFKHKPIDSKKAATIIQEAGGSDIVFFESGAQFAYAYQLPVELKRVRTGWDTEMPSFDAGWIYTDLGSEAEEACAKEMLISSKLMSEMTSIGSHYECTVTHKDGRYQIGLSPEQFVGGRLPKLNEVLPGWWQDRMPLAGSSQDLIECQNLRLSAMANYERFTGKKPRFAVCVARKNLGMEYWMVGK